MKDVILGTHAVPDNKGNGVAASLPYVVPFVQCQVIDTISHPLMYSFLFHAIEVNNIHLYPSRWIFVERISTLQLISILPIFAPNWKGFKYCKLGQVLTVSSRFPCKWE